MKRTAAKSLAKVATRISSNKFDIFFSKSQVSSRLGNLRSRDLLFTRIFSHRQDRKTWGHEVAGSASGSENGRAGALLLKS